MLVAKEKHFKVLLIGDANVGKTSFVQRYSNDSFRRDYTGTVGVDFALKVLRVSGDKVVKLQLWDIAGQILLVSVKRAKEIKNGAFTGEEIFFGFFLDLFWIFFPFLLHKKNLDFF